MEDYLEQVNLYQYYKYCELEKFLVSRIQILDMECIPSDTVTVFDELLCENVGSCFIVGDFAAYTLGKTKSYKCVKQLGFNSNAVISFAMTIKPIIVRDHQRVFLTSSMANLKKYFTSKFLYRVFLTFIIISYFKSSLLRCALVFHNRKWYYLSLTDDGIASSIFPCMSSAIFDGYVYIRNPLPEPVFDHEPLYYLYSNNAYGRKWFEEDNKYRIRIPLHRTDFVYVCGLYESSFKRRLIYPFDEYSVALHLDMTEDNEPLITIRRCLIMADEWIRMSHEDVHFHDREKRKFSPPSLSEICAEQLIISLTNSEMVLFSRKIIK